MKDFTRAFDLAWLAWAPLTEPLIAENLELLERVRQKLAEEAKKAEEPEPHD